jgi:hypothetical protein
MNQERQINMKESFSIIAAIVRYRYAVGSEIARENLLASMSMEAFEQLFQTKPRAQILEFPQRGKTLCN